MVEVMRIAENISRQLPHVKSGTLQFYGDWFGRPMDNVHVVKGVRAEESCLVVLFNQGEILRVWDPQGVTIDDRKFIIQRASKVRWEWYYRRPQFPEKFFFREYVYKGSIIEESSNVYWKHEFRTDPLSAAVQIR